MVRFSAAFRFSFFRPFSFFAFHSSTFFSISSLFTFPIIFRRCLDHFSHFSTSNPSNDDPERSLNSKNERAEPTMLTRGPIIGKKGPFQQFCTRKYKETSSERSLRAKGSSEEEFEVRRTSSEMR